MSKRNTFIIYLLFFPVILWFKSDIVCFANEPVIVVIDPGHGGENLGAQYEKYTEKELNMIVAKSMKEHLEKYEDVVVYLTHEDDIDMSLKERAEFAKEKNADFLFCLHFNASVHQNLFGTEVWIPSKGELYAKGYQFAEIQMQQMQDLGLYSRGIKTKLNDNGQDYYGILRQCSKLDVPSVLIEHCHLDHNMDKPFYQKGDAQLMELGKRDATAVAKYFGLKSDELNIDYSNYEKVPVIVPDGIVKPDKTEPEISQIEMLSLDNSTGEITVKMNAFDNDSYILYYMYSFDGGKTYSDLQKWPRPVWNQSFPDHTFKVKVPFEQEIDFVACAYNGFDVWKESNHIQIDAISSPQNEESIPAAKVIYEEISYEPLNDYEMSGFFDSEKNLLLLAVSIISMIIIIILCVMVSMIIKLQKSNKQMKKK